MRRFIKDLPQLDKKKKSLDIDARRSHEYPLDFSSSRREKGIYQKVKGKMKLVDPEDRIKSVRENDSQTNESGLEFSLIIDDEGNEDELALRQIKMIHEIENMIMMSRNKEK